MATGGFTIRVSASKNEIAASFVAVGEPLARAASSAITRVGLDTRSKGQASIAANGFGPRWQKTLRVNFYPKDLNKPSIDATAFVFHKIPYSEVFESPTTIAGKPLFWLPLSGAMKGVKGGQTPANLKAKGVKLFSFKGAAKPLLGVSLRLPKNGAKNPPTLAKLRKGTAGKTGVVRNVPLFVGVPKISLRKAFNIGGIARQEAARLPALYDAALRSVAER